MSSWGWLTEGIAAYNWRFVARVVVKAGLLFVLLNVAHALLEPMPLIGRLTLHNHLLPGRARLPYGEHPAAYNLSVDSLEAMFATHEISQPKAADEFRVLLIGDSATWGVLLRPEDTLAGQINAMAYMLDDGRTVRAYNVGHPMLSLTKDLLLLDYAMQYTPDMIVWLMTLQSFERGRQLDAALVQRNVPQVHNLIVSYGLNLDAQDARLSEPDFFERTIIGQRRVLADWLRLQLYGVMWAATGIDQFYPEAYTPRANDFEADLSWLSYALPQSLTTNELAFDVIAAGLERAGDVPLLLINEPIFIADGENSELRYNFWYPRWAYDAYRVLYAAQAETYGWRYLDLWDAIASDEFTDSPVHLTSQGMRQLAEIIGTVITDF